MKTGFKTKLIALLLAIAMLAELSPVSAVDLTEEPAPQPSEETEGQGRRTGDGPLSCVLSWRPLS